MSSFGPGNGDPEPASGSTVGASGEPRAEGPPDATGPVGPEPAGGVPWTGGAATTGDPPVPDPPVPPRTRHAPGWAVLLIAVLAVAAAAAGVLAIARRSAHHPVRTATGSPATGASPTGPQTPTGSPTEPPGPTEAPPARTVTVVAPTTLVGRSKSTDPAVAGLADKVAKSIQPPSGQTQASGAYGSLRDGDLIIFTAVTGSNSDAGEMLDVLADKVFTTARFHPVDPGTLAGAARCADASTARTPTTFCLWADSGSLGLVYFFDGMAAQADRLLAGVRAEIEVVR
jgi:hypothetical protein